MILAYVLSSFPTISETFIIEELIQLDRLNIKVVIFSLKPPRRDLAGDSTLKKWAEQTWYSPYFFGNKLWFENVKFILQQPAKFIRLLFMILNRLGFQPIELLKTLAVLPKVIYFSSIAKREGCQRIHAHFVNVPTMAALMMARILNVPFSCTGHGSDIFEYPPQDLKDRIRDASPFITISNFNKEYLSRHYKLKKDVIHVIHCGLDLPRYVHKNKDIPSNRSINILTVARLEYVKGVDIALETSRLLLNRNVNFTWSIIGDGSQRNSLQDLHSKLHLGLAVIFHGTLPHHEVMQYFEQTDLFVLTSRREGIPVSLMESMALGVPVIAPEITGIPELVENGVSGLLVPKLVPQTVCDAVIGLLSNPSMYQKLSRYSRVGMDMEFDGKKNAEKLVQLWMG